MSEETVFSDRRKPLSRKTLSPGRALCLGFLALILAGGLHAGNVERAMEILRPDVVDVSSGVEGQDGKDAVKIKEFIGKVRRHG